MSIEDLARTVVTLSLARFQQMSAGSENIELPPSVQCTFSTLLPDRVTGLIPKGDYCIYVVTVELSTMIRIVIMLFHNYVVVMGYYLLPVEVWWLYSGLVLTVTFTSSSVPVWPYRLYQGQQAPPPRTVPRRYPPTHTRSSQHA